MAAAAKMAGLSFILNVILDEKKRVAAAFAGEPEFAHAAGCACLAAHAGVGPSMAPVVLTTNGGYPLDQNLYQCVKGLATAEQFCEQGGVIILAAACEDGLGGESFYHAMADAASPSALLNGILSVPAEQTRIDQWQYQILARILQRRKVIVVTNEALRDKIEQMHMHSAASIEEALQKAADWIGQYRRIIIIPDGVGVYAKK
jgi:nickel-dependent lactate racemase